MAAARMGLAMGERGSPPNGPLVGLDIGATKVSAGVVDRSGRVTGHSGALRHPNEGPSSVLPVAFEAVERALGGSTPPGRIGIGVAAQVDPSDGSVRYAPNLDWRSVPLARLVAERFRCPVIVSNDARSAAFGEWRFGAGAGAANLLTVIVGTGVGGGVVVGGRLLGGASNALGEIGHVALVAGGRKCHCPARGCLEAYVGGWAIAERAQERVRREPRTGRALVKAAGSLERIDARSVAKAARDGDPLAESIVRTTSDYLATGVAGLVNAFNPDRVVMGGGVVLGWPFLVEAVARRVRESCQPPAASAARVSAAALGAEAVLVGAAALAAEVPVVSTTRPPAPLVPRPRGA
jgi:glucokinase